MHRRESPLDADDAAFIEGMEAPAFGRAAAFACRNAIQPFVDLAAARVVAALWGEADATMAAWLAAWLPLE